MFGSTDTLRSSGVFLNELDAARAFNNAAIQQHGEFATLSPLPDDGANTRSLDSASPELTPTRDCEEFSAQSGDVVKDFD